MSLKLKILYLLEEMDSMCLDNEEERMEAAARLAEGLAPAPTTADDGATLDDLITELVTADPLDWEHVNGERSLRVGDSTISLRNFNSTSALELFVCGQPMLLKPHHRTELFKMCHNLRACEQAAAITRAVRDLRLTRKGKDDF